VLARWPAGLQGGDLVEIGLVQRPHLVHQLPVAGDPFVELLTPAPDAQQVRREAAQPVRPGLAQEAAA